MTQVEKRASRTFADDMPTLELQKPNKDLRGA